MGDEKKRTTEKVDLDTILINEIGQFGKYQITTIFLAAIGVIFSAFTADYIFTSARINTRCLIPECENLTETEFSPSWIQNAIPMKDGSLESCKRYRYTNESVFSNDTCPAMLFDNSTVSCDTRVYEHSLTVVYDFDLGCEEWRRTLIGFSGSLGTFASLPISGYISDRWGRRVTLAINCFNTGWLGLVRYWAGSYTGFIAAQICATILGSGAYSTTYILVLEMVGPKYRVIGGGILSSTFSLGQVLLGLSAWAVPYWKTFTLAFYIPQLLTIGYFWVISESVRWLMSKGRYAESEAQLKEAARINGKQLSEKSLEMLRITTEEEKMAKTLEEAKKAEEPWLIVLVFRHKQILIRCLVLPIWWMTTTLVYYGLSINAVDISGNSYLNYMAVCAVEIPGFWIGVVLLSKIGRRLVLMGAFWTCAACQVAYIFVPTEMYGLALCMYLVGKCAISTVVIAIYVYTSELFPTRYRHSLFAFASMIGRFGSIIAPLTPAMGASTFAEMPFVLFGSMALISGFLLFLTPETLDTKLPDTMEEAENIGLQQKH